MAKAAHLMIRVSDEARSRGFYETAFGLVLAERIVLGDRILVYLSNAECEFELALSVEATLADGSGDRNGFVHLAFLVDDIAAEHARFVEEGLASDPIVEQVHEGHLLSRFFDLRDPDGHNLRVLQRQGRYR